MKLVVDIDGILCHNSLPDDFHKAVPIKNNILRVNSHYDLGDKVTIHTSRLEKDRIVTENWLKENKVFYHKLIFGKPKADLYIDDRALPFVPFGQAKLNRKRLAICYSGGLDSYLAYMYARHASQIKEEDILLLFFDYGQPYLSKELMAIKQIGLPYKMVSVNLVNKDLGIDPTVENYIVPGRNMVMASIAAAYAETVWVVGVKGENHMFMYDKNEEFYRLASLACSQAVGAETSISSPFIHKSKVDVIHWLDEWNKSRMSKEKRDNPSRVSLFSDESPLEATARMIGQTVSCHHPYHKRCGECVPCFKRWVATTLCGIREEHSVYPPSSVYAQGLIEQYEKAMESGDHSHFSKERIEETFDALARRGVKQ